jgi:3-hydroxybutyryl-CoA dehydrogenase
MHFTQVGVVGAGVMGTGLAQSLAETGHQVFLVDVGEDQLRRAKLEIQSNIRMQVLFKKKSGGDSTETITNRITFTCAYDRLKEAEFVIENVTEKWSIKEEVYRRLDSICRPSCVFGANTSAISITRIASATQRPDRVVGMHFMNPVPLKPMVEVIRGHHTSPSTLETAMNLLAAMGKECIVVEDMPGFVSNRVLMLTINEAIWLVQDRVCPASDIDRLFKSCFGHKMGPLETGDLIGLDTILYSLEVLYESYNDDKYRPCPLLKKMVHAGLHGRKTGEGFYKYESVHLVQRAGT